MKKISVLLLAVGMVLTAAGAARGAIHNLKGEFVPYYDFDEFIMDVNVANNDLRWFSVKPADPYKELSVDSADYTDNYGFYFFDNPQTFAEVHNFDYGPGSVLSLREAICLIRAYLPG
ncbi:MAG: hypothetical protein ACM3WV_00020 [Bacillota bacterium]